jgi:penicillin-binding protein 2
MARGYGPEPERRSITRRGLFLLGVQGLAMGALALRMRQLQVKDSDRYFLLAEENRVNIRLIPPARGQIFDRNGLPVAENRQNYRVVLIREQTDNVEETLDQLERLIPITARERERVLREIKRKSAFVPVAVTENLEWEEFARVNSNTPVLRGVDLEVGLTRFYPEAETMAHVIGYVGRVSEKELVEDGGRTPLLQIADFRIGKSGLETRAEDTLRGAAGVSRIEVNAVGRVIRELDRKEGAAGADLQVTIDLDLQRYATERLAGESAAAVILDIPTGDILALASAPSFDPNKFVFGISNEDWAALRDDEYHPMTNKTVAGAYPPGSTFKMVVALAALEAGVISPGERVFCNGKYELGDRFFHCWRRGGHGQMKLVQSLRESCDVYYYEVARRVGIDNIAAMARRLGLGERPDLPLTSINDGFLPSKEWKLARHDQSWQVGDTLNAGIGQGYMLATPIQLATMTARIASGEVVTPRLIRAVDGVPLSPPPREPLAIAGGHLRHVREGMFEVMNHARGTARRARLAEDGVQAAGKTGTSQVRRITKAERAAGVTRNEDLPWARRDHALFVSYAPYDNPRYAISVVVEHGGSGSGAAAPIAQDLMLRAIYGPTPPLAAYPPERREEIRRERESPEPPPQNPRKRA